MRKKTLPRKSAISTSRLVLAIVVAVIVIVAVVVAVRYAFQPAAPTTTKIVFSGWVSSGSEYLFDVAMVNQFNKQNPNITVVFTPITQNYYSTLQTELETNTGPAVFYMENTELPRFAKAGYLAPLTFLENAKYNGTPYNLSDFAPSILKTFYYNGTLYAAPKDWSPLLVFYNIKLFQEAGVSPPPQNWTWSQMVSILAALKAKLPPGNVPMVIDPSWARVLAFVHEAGGDWINSAGNGVYTPTDGMLAGIEFYYSLYRDGYAQLAANTTVASAGWAGGDFAQGHVAMVVDGTWTIPVLESSQNMTKYGVDWGVQWMPSNVTRATMGFYVGLAMNAHLSGAQKVAAEKFITFFTSKQGEFRWIMNGLAEPVRQSLINNQTWAQAFPANAYAAKQAPFAYGWSYNTTKWDLVQTDVQNIITKLFETNTLTPQQAFQQIVNVTNTDLQGP